MVLPENIGPRMSSKYPERGSVIGSIGDLYRDRRNFYMVSDEDFLVKDLSPPMTFWSKT